MTRPSRQLLYGSLVFFGILLIAVIGYTIIDHSTPLDAFYMVVLTISASRQGHRTRLHRMRRRSDQRRGSHPGGHRPRRHPRHGAPERRGQCLHNPQRGLNPDIEVIAHGEEPSTEPKLLQAGARRVVLPAHIGADRMAHMILHPAAADFAESDEHTRHLQADLGDLGVHLEEIPVPKGSTLVGSPIGEIESSGANAFLVIALRRNGAIQSRPPADTILAVGDQLIVIGHIDSALKLTRKSTPASYHYRGART